MIQSVEFEHFKVLAKATLPLSRFTLVIGPNGSGKSTALQGLQSVARPTDYKFSNIVTAGSEATAAQITVNWGEPYRHISTTTRWLKSQGREGPTHKDISPTRGTRLSGPLVEELNEILANIRIYSFDPESICTPIPLEQGMILHENGANLASIIDQIRDNYPERYEALNEEFTRWLPEFDKILPNLVGKGQKTIRLRTRHGQHLINAKDLSHGTVLALAILTVAYLPNSPRIACLEEPDRGLHPRLLRNVKDALYRLSYPESFGETRPAVQVIATTHSPYFLDLFQDHPEEVVIAHKVTEGARFERLVDRPDIQEILGDTHLGDAWYSGVLGGVPSQQ